jgi:hypothetical protein
MFLGFVGMTLDGPEERVWHPGPRFLKGTTCDQHAGSRSRPDPDSSSG